MDRFDAMRGVLLALPLSTLLWVALATVAHPWLRHDVRWMKHELSAVAATRGEWKAHHGLCRIAGEWPARA